MSSTPFIEVRADVDVADREENMSHTSAEGSQSQSRSQAMEEYLPLHRHEEDDEGDELVEEGSTSRDDRAVEQSLIDEHAAVPHQPDIQALREEAAPTTGSARSDPATSLMSAASTSPPPSLRQPGDLERSPSTQSEAEKDRARAQRRHTISSRIASERKKLQLSARKRVSLGTPGSADLRRRLDMLKAASSSQAGSPAAARRAAGSAGRPQAQTAGNSQGGDDSMLDVQNLLVPRGAVSAERASKAEGSPGSSAARRNSVSAIGFLARAMEPDSESELEQEEDDEVEEQRPEQQSESDQEAEMEIGYLAKMHEPDSSDDEAEELGGRSTLHDPRGPGPDENEEDQFGYDHLPSNGRTRSPSGPTPPPKDEGDDDDRDVSRTPVIDTPAALIADFDNFLALTMVSRGGPPVQQNDPRNERSPDDQAEPGYTPPDEPEPGQGYEMDHYGDGGDYSDAGGDDLHGGLELAEEQDDFDDSDENDGAEVEQQPAGRIQFDSQNRLRRTTGAKPKGAFHECVVLCTVECLAILTLTLTRD